MRRPAGTLFACSFLSCAALSLRLDRAGRACFELDRAPGPAQAAGFFLLLAPTTLMGGALPVPGQAFASGAARAGQ